MSVRVSGNQLVCPRCRNTMMLLIQSEIGDRVTTTTYVYVCTVCRYKQIVERVKIEKNGDKLLVDVVRQEFKTS